MARFQYVAIGADGDQKRGELEAGDRPLATEMLRGVGLMPIELAEVGAANHAASFALPRAVRPVRGRVVTRFTRQLAILINAGLTLDGALTVVGNDASLGSIEHTIGMMRKELAAGKALSEVLAGSELFTTSYVTMIRVAEATGRLPEVLQRIADERERREQVRRKVVSSLLYPMLLVVTAVGAVLGLLAFVVPQFKTMIEGSGRPPPPAAEQILWLSDTLIARGPVLALVLAAAVAGAVLGARSTAGRQLLWAFVDRLPLAGRIVKDAAAISFCRTLGVLLDSGVETAKALALCADAARSSPIHPALRDSVEALRKGESFVGVLEQSGTLPAVAISMLRLGDETGRVGQCAGLAAAHLEQELDETVDRTIKLVEPLVVLLTSLLVAWIMIGIITSVMAINELAI